VLKQVEAEPGVTAAEEAFSLTVELLDASMKNVQLSFRLGACALRGYQESLIESGSESSPTADLLLSVQQVEMVFAQA
jgi:hypothetical protein